MEPITRRKVSLLAVGAEELASLGVTEASEPVLPDLVVRGSTPDWIPDRG
jgi:hypothetical protein